MTNYKKLEVWILSMELVKEIYKLTKLYPGEERYGLTSQTNRAAVSIPSNIAEGMGRNSTKDTIHYLYISRGSAYELDTLLSVALMVRVINEELYQTVMNKLDSSVRLINGLIRHLEKKI